MYWFQESRGNFPAMNYGNVMSHYGFEVILRFLQLSADASPDMRLLHFIDAVNQRFRNAIGRGTFKILEKSMIKFFQPNLKGKMKI